jgi:hypothetical protein
MINNELEKEIMKFRGEDHTMYFINIIEEIKV